jgi:hypothetical protein
MAATSISFVASTVPAFVYWYPSGDRTKKKLYRKLTPGQAYTQPTYCAHVWGCETGDANNNTSQLLLLCTAQEEDFLHVIPGSAGACDNPKGGAKTVIRFKNEGKVPLEVVWVTPGSGKEVFQCQLEAGSSQGRNSFCGHVFRVRSGSGNVNDKSPCLMVCTAAEEGMVLMFRLTIFKVHTNKSCIREIQLTLLRFEVRNSYEKTFNITKYRFKEYTFV